MNLLRGTVMLSALATLTLCMASCAKRPGYDRPMNQQRLHGFHRGGAYNTSGAGTYNPSKQKGSSYYRHYGR